MSRDSERDARVPERSDFLKLVWEGEDRCERETDTRLPSMGKKAPACLDKMGTVLSLLDRMASCWWACRGGDHLIEYLCGRVVSTSCAALRLIRLGYYDEALLLARGVGEIANLLHLFNEDRGSFEQWKASSRRDRLKEFSPVKVRLRLQASGSSPPISQERYTLLSERAAHVHPGTRPQSHNILEVPIVGGIFQDEGVLVCLNELAAALGLAAAFAAPLLDLERSLKIRIVDSAISLGEELGGVNITEIDSHHQRVLDDPLQREEIERLAREFRKLQDDRRKL